MKLNYILVDSDPIHRIQFLQILKKFPEISLQGEFSDAVNAKEFLNYNDLDFVIVSADLPVYSGFDFIENLKVDTEVILLTKQPMDAVKSFELGLIDCILKPVNLNRFKNSIERLIHKVNCLKIIREKNERMVHFKCNFKSEKIFASDIRWIEAMGDYVKVVTKNKNYMVLSTMKSFLSKLPEGQFVRIHKSYIVNLDKVSYFTSKDVNTDGKMLPLSRNQKNIFKDSYLKYQ